MTMTSQQCNGGTAEEVSLTIATRQDEHPPSKQPSVVAEEDHVVLVEHKNSDVLQSLVRETPHATKAYHKELLYGLLLQSNDQELGVLAEKANLPRLSEQQRAAMRRPRKRPRTDLAWENKEPSTLSLLPRALFTAASASSPLHNKKKKKRKDLLPSKTLEQVEHMVQERFQQKQGVRKSNPSDIWMDATFEPFSLVYNECSLAAIATWALKTPSSSKDSLHRPVPSARLRRCSTCQQWGHYEVECTAAASDVLAQETRAQLASKAKSNNNNNNNNKSNKKRKRRTQEQEALSTQVSPCHVCKTVLPNEPFVVCRGCSRSFHETCLDDTTPQQQHFVTTWLCGTCEQQQQVQACNDIVDLEGCDGFVIEQRCKTEKEQEWGFPDDGGWSCAIGLRRSDNIPDGDGDAAAAAAAVDSHDTTTFGGGGGGVIHSEALSRGELCWTRRNCDDSKPLSANDDWWPSVVRVARPGKDGTTVVYIVKRFSLAAVNCKTTVALSFFQYFEQLGYNRVKGNHSYKSLSDADRFEKALVMAAEELGCMSLSQCLQQAREICGGDAVQESPLLTEDLQLAECLDETWSDDAQETEQDRFLVRAKRDALIDRVAENAPTVLLGSVVAWFQDTTNNNDAPAVMHVGIVLAANLGNELALVRPVRNWQEAFSQESSHTDSFVVRSGSVGSSVWRRITDLHMISSGVPARVTKMFSDELLPKRLYDERERLRRSYQQAKKLHNDDLRVFGSPLKKKHRAMSNTDDEDDFSVARLDIKPAKETRESGRARERNGTKQLDSADKGIVVGTLAGDSRRVEASGTGRIDMIKSATKNTADEEIAMESGAKETKTGSPHSVAGREEPAEPLLDTNKGSKSDLNAVSEKEANVGRSDAEASTTPEVGKVSAAESTAEAALDSAASKFDSDVPMVDDDVGASEDEASRTQSVARVAAPSWGGDKLAEALLVKASSRTGARKMPTTDIASVLESEAAEPASSSRKLLHTVKAGSTSKTAQSHKSDNSVTKPTHGKPLDEEVPTRKADEPKASGSKSPSSRKAKGSSSEMVADGASAAEGSNDEPGRSPSRKTTSEATSVSPSEQAELRASRSKNSSSPSEPLAMKHASVKGSSAVPASQNSDTESSPTGKSDTSSAGNGNVDNSNSDAHLKELSERGIYQVEAILDDRQISTKSRTVSTRTEYLIKWYGFSMDESTWEPKRNIWNPSLVDKYEVDKIYDSLVKTPEAHVSNTIMNRVLQALTVGRERLDKLIALQDEGKDVVKRPTSKNTTRLCPFCDSESRNLFHHIKVHSGSKNFNLIKEAALLAEPDWYA